MNQIVVTSQPPSQEVAIQEHFVLELKKQLTGKRMLFLGGTAVALMVLVPMLIFIAKAISLALGIGLMVVMAVVAKIRLPLWLLKIENRVQLLLMQERNAQLARLKNEARKNPIETLQNEYIAMERQREGIRTANTAFLAASGAYATELAENKRHDPSVDYSDEERTAAEMQRVCGEQAGDLTEFVQALTAFKKKIDEAERKWNLALKANAAFALLDDAEKSSKMRDILVQVSFDEVRNQYSGLFARMNTRAIELSAARSMRIGHTAVDVSTINIPTIKEEDRVAITR